MEYEEQYKHQDYSDDEYMDDNIGHENEMSTYLNMTDMDGQIYSDLEEEEAQAMKFNAGDKSSKRAWSLDRWAKGQCTDDELMSRSDRSEPRMELVDVGLWNFANSTTQDQLVWLYEHCCMVEKLNISSFQTEVNPKVIANIIKTLCTKIRTLTFRRSELGYWSGTLPFEVLCAMPKQQLITIDYRKVEYRLTEEMTQISILRHSDTLTTLILQECDQISSKAIQVILKVCTGLIHLQLGWDEDEVPSYIHLEDAISTSWASNKFTYLELTIAIPKLRYESTQIPYYRRHPKCILTPSETHLFSQLQTLYYQLASLRDLTQLDLRALESGADDISVIDPFYFEHTFPAMFSLGDTRSGRPGFLTLFEGWTRLKEIRGSFSICTNETFETMNTLEASWIATHWPALKFIEFHQGDEEEEREVFRWLEDYRQLYDPAFSIGLGY
ncbi:hypothetical protein FBU30_000986 [Linnemannia zychae]|nr:hypothetical protein FBU30_000986 [Linnemannia zychae]